MKVSIIIPIYKVEQYIEDCLRSVYNQSYKNLEIILVDDCTPDDSMLIARNFVSKKELPKGMEIKFLSHKKNRGLSAARNTGIDAATGDYIYFLDSDDELSPDCISLLAEPLKKRQYDFIIGDYIITGSDNEYPPLKLEEGEYLGNQAIFHYYCHKFFYMMAWNKLCNLEFIKKEKLFFKEGLIHEDELWSLQVALVATSMYAIRKPTYVYKIRQGSITENENEREKIKFLIRVFKIIDDILKNDQIHSFKDVYQIYNDFLNKKYIRMITQGWYHEYVALRSIDSRPFIYILKSLFRSKHSLLTYGHCLLPSRISYPLCSFIYKLL